MTKEPLWTRNFIFLILFQIMNSFTMQFVMTIFPLHLVNHNYGGTEIGLVIGVFTISALCVRPLVQNGVHIFGNKPLITAGLLICVIANILYACFTSILPLVFARLLHGIGFAIITTLITTFAANTLPLSRQGEGLGYFGFGNVISMAFAPFIALSLFSAGFFNIFLFPIGSVTLSMILIVFFFRIPTPKVLPGIAAPSRAFNPAIVKKLLLPGLLMILVGVCACSVMNYIAVFGKERLAIDNIGVFFIIVTISLFSARLLSGRIYDRKGHAWILFPGAIIMFIGLFSLSQASSLYHTLFSAFCYGIAMGSLQPAILAWLMRLVTVENRNMASAAYYNGYDLGLGAGSFLLGHLAEKTSFAYMYFYASFSMVAFLIIYSIALLRIKHQKAHALP
ncbi:MAG: MFS transporter [Peptococcaceae bacterium]|jgi:MFS family permease|nr:MFS transporter [Peptococcaceae bacterium]